MIHSIIHYTDGKILPFRRCVLVLVIALCCMTQVQGQFAPVVGYPGTTAMPYDSSAFVAWATGCSIQRGYQDVASPSSGYASAGDSSAAVGMATTNGIVSLGDGGIATLTFASPIINGSGFDFAVFENGFSVGGPGMAFLELAFVEVSSDGTHFVRFPAVYNAQDTSQLGNGGTIDGSLLNNLAGKYVSGYGTPFDLDELKDSTGLDVNNITHVRVIDVVGALDSVYGTRDSRGYKINDPFPTNFASSGFDLDAIGVIHQRTIIGISDISSDTKISIYPNPALNTLNIHNRTGGISEAILTDVSGGVLMKNTFENDLHLDVSALPTGIYCVKVIDQEHVFSRLIVKQ